MDRRPSPISNAALCLPVVEGDRVDNLAAQYLGDPELYWRLCDANGVMRPDDLTETAGAKVAITLPEGIPGASDA